MKIVGYKPMWFDSFYVSFLSSQYKTGKTKWLTASWNGFISNLKALFDKKKMQFSDLPYLQVITKT